MDRSHALRVVERLSTFAASCARRWWGGFRRASVRGGEGTGFTLIEMLLVVVIIGMLGAIAIPRFSEAVAKARYTKAIGDLRAIGQSVTEYHLENGVFPSSLTAVGFDATLDPWGNPYEYLPITGKGKGAFRKDKFLVPINSDFDLYSRGPDGASSAPLNAKNSRDDVIRANDGGFVGLAEDF